MYTLRKQARKRVRPSVASHLPRLIPQRAVIHLRRQWLCRAKVLHHLLSKRLVDVVYERIPLVVKLGALVHLRKAVHLRLT